MAFTGGQTLKIVLAEDTKALDEVVVVGYGTQKKANLTGSVAAVNFDDVANIPVANTSTMLQGRLPGVVLQTNGAQAGHDDPEIRVRGVGTLGDGSKNNPMVLIDGIESSISQMSELAAEDIESVSVLKDAASAAIYGVRAANGVILVTTKRGAEQRPTISYSGSVALQEATVFPDFVNSYEWAKMYNECQPGKAYTDDMLQKLKDGSDPDHFANTNWAKEMFRTAVMHQHHLSVNGGSQNTHYMLSASYMDQDGIMKNTNNRRYNFRSNIDSKLGIVKLGLNLSGSRQDIQEPVNSVTGEGLMRALTWFTRPTVPVRYMQNIKWLNSLKLRGSWGKLGNQEIGNYAYSETLSAQGSYYFGDKKYIGMKTTKVANEKIKWETTTITDFGFDASFWGGRISVVFDWYDKVTDDILLQLPMPGIFLGTLGAPYQNAGKVRNRGWELAGNYQDRRGDWQWQAGFSLAGVSNRIIDMNGQESISGSTINREGYAIGSYYALKAIGLYRTEADLQRTNSEGKVITQNGQTPVLGDIMYEDFNDDGNINDEDRQIIGNPFPKLQFSFTLGASWKNFDLTTFWQGVSSCTSCAPQFSLSRHR